MVQGDWETWHLYKVWVRSGRVTLPHAGGWLDQPAYLTKSFDLLDSVGSWHEMNAKRKKKPSRGRRQDMEG